MAKKQSKSTPIVEEDAAVASTPINDRKLAPFLSQEIRLAEARPGDIEALEQAFDKLNEDHSILFSSYNAICNDSAIMEEANLVQEEMIRRQAANIIHNHSTIASLEDALDRAMGMITDLHSKLMAKSTTTSTTSSGLSRKDQVLSIMLPDGPSSCPGPHVTIAQLALVLNTNNKNVSSILTPLRDLGYAIMTDELGRKYISSYDPKASYKHNKTQPIMAVASATITPDALIASIN